jgi:hypothetical protein
LDPISAGRGELYLGLSESELKVRLPRQRGGRKAAALLQCLGGDFIQRAPGNSERYPDVE